MLYKFKSQEAADVIMLKLNAEEVLQIIGKPASPTGIITVEQVPAAVAALKAEVQRREAMGQPQAASDERSPQDEVDEAKARTDLVTLRQRVTPFIELLERSAAAARTWCGACDGARCIYSPPAKPLAPEGRALDAYTPLDQRIRRGLQQRACSASTNAWQRCPGATPSARAAALQWLTRPSASVLCASPMRALVCATVQAAMAWPCRKGSAARPASSLPTPASLNTAISGRAASAYCAELMPPCEPLTARQPASRPGFSSVIESTMRSGGGFMGCPGKRRSRVRDEPLARLQVITRSVG